MKKKTTDINPERSEKYRHLEKLGYVPKFIIISACCGFVAFVAMVLSVLAMYNSTSASAKVDYELPRIQAEHDQSVKRTDLYIVYAQELYVLLKDLGLDPPPLPEEE
jgi:hypothetical protein